MILSFIHCSFLFFFYVRQSSVFSFLCVYFNLFISMIFLFISSSSFFFQFVLPCLSPVPGVYSTDCSVSPLIRIHEVCSASKNLVVSAVYAALLTTHPV